MWWYCKLIYPAMDALGIDEGHYAYADFVLKTQNHINYSDEGWCGMPDVEVARHLRKDKATIGRRKKNLIRLGIVEVDPDNKKRYRATEKFENAIDPYAAGRAKMSDFKVAKRNKKDDSKDQEVAHRNPEVAHRNPEVAHRNFSPIIYKDKEKGRKGNADAAASPIFSPIEQDIRQVVTGRDGRKHLLDLLDDTGYDLERLALEVGALWLAEEKTLNLKFKGSVTGLITYCVNYCNNLPKVSGEDDEKIEEDLSTAPKGNGVQERTHEVVNLWERIIFRKIGCERKKGLVSLVRENVIKARITDKELEERFSRVRFKGESFSEIEYTLQNLDKLKVQ